MKKTTFFLLLFLFSCGIKSFSQQETDEEPQQESYLKKTNTLMGLYVGSYFANKYTATMYNGYGFDLAGKQNSFSNSLMRQKIIFEYGGGYGQHDQIAEVLGVDPGMWTFNESDMPTNMRYTPAIMVGVNLKTAINKKTSVLLNINGAKLNVEGAFTITKIRPQNPNPAVNSNIVTCPIRGSEQRLCFQLGFQRLLGKDERLNFLVECGLTGTLSKYNQNTIYINTLTIDLTQYLNSSQYISVSQPARRPVGFGLGGYAGLGVNLDMNENFIVQLVYTPSFDKINMGVNPVTKWQNSLGLRFYYKI